MTEFKIPPGYILIPVELYEWLINPTKSQFHGRKPIERVDHPDIGDEPALAALLRRYGKGGEEQS